MTGRLQPLHERLREARRRQGITQSELARDAACSQSAISMFESGRTDALSGKTMERLAERLRVHLSRTETGAHAAEEPASLSRLKYCPVDDCPSNIPYVVRGALHFKPSLVQARADQATRCPLCGEVLEDRCPNADCGAPLIEGGTCSRCGEPYVPATQALRGPLDVWVRRRRDDIRELWTMSETHRREA